MQIDEEEYLQHYGIIRRSGRYPWGSSGWGEGGLSETEKRNKIFLDMVEEEKAKGLTDAQIAEGHGMSLQDLRDERSVAVNMRKAANVAAAQRLRDRNWSHTAIGNRMGVGESTVRSWLKPGADDAAKQLFATMDTLRKEIDTHNEQIDVGKGVENHVGVTRSKLDVAIAGLKQEGYTEHTYPSPQVSGHQTQMRVLAPKGRTQKEAWENRFNTRQIMKFSDDFGRTYYGIRPPIAVNPKRLQVVWKEQGGDKADGMIYLRPGVDDLSLGGKNYGQVRIKIGPDHYIKGMAIYSKDLPDGVDLQWHTAKSSEKLGGNVFDAMKPIKAEDNPFGSIVRQILNDDGTEPISALNIVAGKSDDPDSGNVEGKWSEWSRRISSQVLSKQDPALAKSHLDVTKEIRQNDFEAIKALTNPTVKKRLLKYFADNTDAASVHLKTAAMPRQESVVIIPINSLKDHEVYSTSFQPGERVVLIRHPHGGVFEIPELVVNDRNAEARRLLGVAGRQGASRDAIGINHNVAQRMSGADFDGDTVLIIPDPNGKFKTAPAVEELQKFDPKHSYPGYEGMHVMTDKHKQNEMGRITNLITDMSLQGAPIEDLTRAIKHSMVVIDAVNHQLNYRQSEQDNGIKDLKARYQPEGGASTLISRAKGRTYVPKRKERLQGSGGGIDPVTGEKRYEEVPPNKKGQTFKQRSTNMAETTDAYTLSSGTRMENLYAEYANNLKAMANQARLEYLNTPTEKQNASAKKVYAPQVETLHAKLELAKRNKPLERAAQIVAQTIIKAQTDANPGMDDDQKAKLKYQAQAIGRARTGAKKYEIVVTPEEWNAIQAGAIGSSKLNEILDHADMDVIREYATPKRKHLMSKAEVRRAEQMLELGFTRAEVAQQLQISVSTLDRGVKG